MEVINVMPLRKSKAFVSSFVLIFFMLVALIVTSYAIIIRNNLITIENISNIEKELIAKTKVIYYFKHLDLSNDIRSFVAEDIEVTVVKIEDNYHLNYENHEIIIKVVNNRVYDIK